MKKFWKYIAIAALTVVMAPLTSCDDDDDLGPKDKANYEANFVYLEQPTSTFARVEYKANGDFLSGLTDPLKLVPVRLTKPAPADLQVEVVIDPTLVEEYNTANGTNYTFLEGATIDNPAIGIQAGKYISEDVITISFGDHSGFINKENDLMLPVVVRGGEGLTPSKSSRIFLTFNSTYRPNILSVPTSKLTFNAGILNPGWEETVRTLNAENAIELTYAPYEEVTVNLAIDESKVAEFNQANGTDFEFKADAELAASSLTISTDGNYGSFTINTGDLTGIAEEKAYVIPVTITSAEGAAVELKEGNNTVYVVVKGVGREFSVSASEFFGSAIDNPVACTVAGNTMTSNGYYTWLEAIDNSTWAYGYLNPNDLIEIDFGKVVNLRSFYIYHWYANYSATGMKLETSADGSKWIDWGEVEYEKMDEYFVNLSAAEAVQYMRIVFTGGGYSVYGIEIDGMVFYGE